jgi:hypothetical protein
MYNTSEHTNNKPNSLNSTPPLDILTSITHRHKLSKAALFLSAASHVTSPCESLINNLRNILIRDVRKIQNQLIIVQLEASSHIHRFTAHSKCNNRTVPFIILIIYKKKLFSLID